MSSESWRIIWREKWYFAQGGGRGAGGGEDTFPIVYESWMVQQFRVIPIQRNCFLAFVQFVPPYHACEPIQSWNTQFPRTTGSRGGNASGVVPEFMFWNVVWSANSFHPVRGVYERDWDVMWVGDGRKSFSI